MLTKLKSPSPLPPLAVGEAELLLACGVEEAADSPIQKNGLLHARNIV